MSAIEKSWHESQMAAARKALATKLHKARAYAAQVRAKNSSMQVKKNYGARDDLVCRMA